MSTDHNFYWPIYQSLEQELMNLSYSIYIDDKQISTYSTKIVELLIRCCIEIEAISKDLFSNFACCFPKNDKPYFDTDCINFLNKIWKLDKKKLDVAYVNFYFDDYTNKIITPLKNANKMGDKGSKWKSAYQAVKHHRTRDISKGNIKNLIHAMGALFILNIYYKDEEYSVNNSKDFSFANSLSSIFRIKVSGFNGFSHNGHYTRSEDMDECIYLIKYEKKYEDDFQKWINKQSEVVTNLMLQHPKVVKYINEEARSNGITSEFLSNFFGNNKFLEILDIKQDYAPLMQQAIKIATKETGFKFDSNEKFCAVLNKL